MMPMNRPHLWIEPIVGWIVHQQMAAADPSVNPKNAKPTIATLLLFSTIALSGCKPFGTRPGNVVDQDDWAPPNRNSYSLPQQFHTNSRYKGKDQTKKSESTGTSVSDPKPSSTTAAKPETSPAATKQEIPANQTAANSPKETGVADLDMESALAVLPPHLQEIWRKQMAAAENRKAESPTPKSEPVVASISSSTVSEQVTPAAVATPTAAPAVATAQQPNASPATPPPSLVAAATPEVTKAAEPVRMSLSDRAAETPASPSIPPTSPVATASATIPTDASAKPASDVVAAVAQSAAQPPAASPLTIPPATVESQPTVASEKELEWNEALNVAKSSLQKTLDGNPSMDIRARLNHELALRMIHLANNDLESALEPIEGLAPSEQEYYRHQLQALYESSNPEGTPVASRRWALVMENQRKANHHLASISNLEVRNGAFCTDVQGYGVVTPFQSTLFKPDQDVLLYCELENVSAEEVRGGFETKLQGTYEIVDAQGRRVAEQLLPIEQEVCANHRRDYFVVYRIFTPMQIAPGNYEMRVTIEDMKGKKFGQTNLPFQIQK